MLLYYYTNTYLYRYADKEPNNKCKEAQLFIIRYKYSNYFDMGCLYRAFMVKFVTGYPIRAKIIYNIKLYIS